MPECDSQPLMASPLAASDRRIDSTSRRESISLLEPNQPAQLAGIFEVLAEVVARKTILKHLRPAPPIRFIRTLGRLGKRGAKLR